MNIINKIPHLKSRKFKGKVHPKIKLIREEPRYKIRQLLRSFVPIDQVKKTVQIEDHSSP